MKIYKSILIVFLLSMIISSCGDDNPITQESTKNEEQPPKIVKLSIETKDNKNILDYKKIVVNNIKSIEIVLKNEGAFNIEITKVKIPEGFTTNSSNITIKPNESFELEINFNPTEKKEYNGEIDFTSNITENYKKIKLKGVGVSSTYPGDIILYSQKELEDFISRGYKNVEGKLGLGSEFYGSDFEINDISLLQKIDSVKRLSIAGIKLKNLVGLNHLTITNFVEILFNDNLESLEGFPTQNSGIGINIFRNKNLKSIEALKGITELSYLRLNENISLESLNGLDSLKILDGPMAILYNEKITNLDALSNLKSVSGNVFINNNHMLNNFCGILPLVLSKGIEGRFYDMTGNKYNPSLFNINNLNCKENYPPNELNLGRITILKDSYWYNYIKTHQIKKLHSHIKIKGEDIEDLSVLSSVEELNYLTISETKIKDLNDLKNLKIVKELYTYSNSQLSDYCNLNSIINAGKHIYLRAEDNLYNPTIQDIKNGNCKK